MTAAHGRAVRIHPCLSVPPSEQRLMLVAYHLALADLRRAAPYADWGGLLTAAGLGLRLLAPGKYTPDSIEAAWSAYRALHAYAEGHGGIDAAVAASEAFLPVFEEVLRVVTLRALSDAEAGMVANNAMPYDRPAGGKLVPGAAAESAARRAGSCLSSDRP